MTLLAELTLAPSQLYLNAFAFMREFEIVCDYLHIGATVPLFLQCFRVQRHSSEGRYSWVSFKNYDQRLFRMFVDSIKYFKDMYYIFRLESEAANTSVLRRVPVTYEEGHRVLDEYGEVRTRLTPMFLFRWWKAHFLNDAKDYAYGDEDLDD